MLYGQDYFYEELLGTSIKMPISFFQTNSAGAEVLYEAARGTLEISMRRLSLTCIAEPERLLEYAPVAKKVVGVEIVEEAVRRRRRNAALNGLDNCTFWANYY